MKKLVKIVGTLLAVVLCVKLIGVGFNAMIERDKKIDQEAIADGTESGEWYFNHFHSCDFFLDAVPITVTLEDKDATHPYSYYLVKEGEKELHGTYSFRYYILRESVCKALLKKEEAKE
jgi:hypothetical protein